MKLFKKGQVVRSRVTNRMFVVVGDNGAQFVSVRTVLRSNITLIGNNYKPLQPQDSTRATPDIPNCRCVTKPMAGIPQRPAEEAPPRHGAVTDKLRELMNAVVSKDEQIRVLQNMYDDARTEMIMLRTQLTEANRKREWWKL